MHRARKHEWNQQLRELVSAGLLPEGRRHDGLLSRDEPLRQLPSAVPMLGLPTHRATASSWIVPLHRAASRGSSTQRGVQPGDPVLIVALASGVAKRPAHGPLTPSAGGTATKTEGPPLVQETCCAPAAIKLMM